MGIASQEVVPEVLAAFGLPMTSDWHLLPKSVVKRDELVKASFPDHRPVLIRFHDPDFYTRSDIDRQTLFRSRLHAGGVPVPALYRDKRGRYFIDLPRRGETWMVTVEEWIDGEPPHAVTPPLVSLLGSTLARMHCLSAACGVAFGHGTDMSLFVEDEEYALNAARLRASLERLGDEALGKTRLFAAWDLARDRLAGLWPQLPKGPVHADFAEYNVLLDETEDIEAVIDFNRAGDDVLVNEVVHACLKLPSYGDEGHDRANTARFLGSYEAVRPLSEMERLAVPYLITAIRPFRAREVSPVVEAAERGETGHILRRLSRLEKLAEPGRLLG